MSILTELLSTQKTIVNQKLVEYWHVNYCTGSVAVVSVFIQNHLPAASRHITRWSIFFLGHKRTHFI